MNKSISSLVRLHLYCTRNELRTNWHFLTCLNLSQQSEVSIFWKRKRLIAVKLESLLLGKTHHEAVGLSSGTGSLKARDRVVLKQRCLLAIPNLVFLRLSGSAETVIKLSYSRLLSEQSHFSYDSENCRKTVRITVVHGILLWVGARMRSEYKIKREKFKYILLTLVKSTFLELPCFRAWNSEKESFKTQARVEIEFKLSIWLYPAETGVLDTPRVS